ncbi:MAG: acetyl-CoA decarbonylase/synthase complex subunit alpha/beta [Candidatus Bathyarchaeia archaeon]
MPLPKSIIKGAKAVLGIANEVVKQTISKVGGGAKVSFPGTNYNLPLIYGLTGKKIDNVDDLKRSLEEFKGLVKDEPTLENALNAGVATLLAAEIIEAAKYTTEKEPYKSPFVGFVPDFVIRQLGVPLADGSIPAVAVVLGKAKSVEDAGNLGREIQRKNVLGLLIGPVIDQMTQAGLKIGLDYNLVPIGPELTSAVHAAGVAIRAPLMFGAIEPGKQEEILVYLRDRLPAFLLALGPLDEPTLAAGAGVIAANLPVISDQEVPEIEGKLVSQTDVSKLVETGCALKGVKVKVLKVDVPIEYGPVFEGESVRKTEMFVQFGGGKSTSFEVLRKRGLEEVKDGRVEVIGTEIDKMEEGKAYPLGIVVDVAGDKVEKDMESVFERRIHEFINYGEGLMHVGSRDINWIRISKDAAKKGFKLRHLGDLIYAGLKDRFGDIAERVQVTVISDQAKVEEALAEARPVFTERDERLLGLTEEDVADFYGCTLCQSFAPTHVCIITPERISLCGAISWLDAKAAHKLDPAGPNFIVLKGKPLDPVKGEYEEVNKAVKEKSHGATEKIFLHSIFGFPQTSCGCFEAIAFYIPEVDGIGIVNREYRDVSVNGMTFSTMAGVAGGGKQIDGMLGIGKNYVVSKKFLQADGGLKRLVWMPKALKDELRDRVPEELKDVFERIATEEDAKDIAQLKEYLLKE